MAVYTVVDLKQISIIALRSVVEPEKNLKHLLWFQENGAEHFDIFQYATGNLGNSIRT